VPNGFAIQSPARIALDIPGATNALGKNIVEVNIGNLRSVNVVQAADRARLVLNLRQATNYRTQIEGKSLVVTLEPVGPRPGARRRRRPSPRAATATRSRCATWTSAAGPMVPAA
jgi:type IV pilus assembly protein PilQ